MLNSDALVCFGSNEFGQSEVPEVLVESMLFAWDKLNDLKSGDAHVCVRGPKYSALACFGMDL